MNPALADPSPNEALTDSPAADAAGAQHVHIIDTHPIRRSSTALWDRLRAGIRLRLEQIAHKFDAACEEVDETRFAITTRSGDADAALLQVIRMAHEHAFGLFGKCEIKELEIYRAVSTGPGNYKTSRVPSEKLQSLFQQWEKLQQPVSSAPQLLEISKPPPVDRYAPGTGRPYASESSIPARPGIEIVHQFEPVWDVNHEAISAYICAPKDITVLGSPSERVSKYELTAKERIVLDYSSFLFGIEKLAIAVERGEYFLLDVMISFETLSSPSARATIISACNALPLAYRRYIIFILYDLPGGITQARLSDLITVLRPFARVMASMPCGSRDFGALKCFGLHGIALDLSRAPKDRERIRADIVQIAADGRDLKLGATVLGVKDQEDLLLAQAADIRMMHGPAVMAAQDEPHRMSRLKRDVVMPKSDDGGDEDWFD